MRNNLADRAITVLENAGFEVIGFRKKKSNLPGGIIVAGELEAEDLEVSDDTLLKLWVKPSGQERPELSEPKEFGKGYKFIQSDSGLSRRPGETWDLASMMDTNDWRKTLKSVQKMIQNGCYSLFNIGDFLYVSFEVPAAEHQGVKFEKLKIENAKVQIVEILPNWVIFNFEEILFKSAINAANTNDGGFEDSALSRYLNTEFSDAMGISDLLASKHEDMNYPISLLTAQELFGDSEYWDSKTNWSNGDQIPFFKNEKNRVKVFENETSWYWTSSPSASSSSAFCHVGTGGVSRGHNAGYSGGVAPAFCVA